MKNQLAARGGRVDLLGQALQANLSLGQAGDGFNKMPEGAA